MLAKFIVFVIILILVLLCHFVDSQFLLVIFLDRTDKLLINVEPCEIFVESFLFQSVFGWQYGLVGLSLLFYEAYCTFCSRLHLFTVSEVLVHTHSIEVGAVSLRHLIIPIILILFQFPLELWFRRLLFALVFVSFHCFWIGFTLFVFFFFAAAF